MGQRKSKIQPYTFYCVFPCSFSDWCIVLVQKVVPSEKYQTEMRREMEKPRDSDP